MAQIPLSKIINIVLIKNSLPIVTAMKRSPIILQRAMNIKQLGLQARFLVYIVKVRVIMTLQFYIVPITYLVP